MVALGRRPSWQTQLRETKAKEWLFAGHLDNFPLAQIQDIAAWVLRDRSPLLSRRRIPPQSQQCDILFANELATVKGELGIHESAILACLHLLSYSQARGQILSIRPDASSTDLFFERRLDAYLQCIILSRRVRPDVCSEDEGVAAQELLSVLKGRSADFPSILGLLRAVGSDKCDQLLPVPLIKKTLKLSHYEANLTRELEALLRSRHWFHAYKLVCGLRDIIGLPRADRMLRDMFPDYPVWAAWRPDSRRILSWESPNLTPHRDVLGPVLDLEGPDTTGQQRGTLRMSSPGAFTMLNEPACPHDRQILDRLLESLDACLAVGPFTVELLVALCVESPSLSQHALDQLGAAVQLKNDAVSKTLAAFVRSLAPDTILAARMAALASTLPVLTLHPILQQPFGISIDLARLASDTLCAGQRHFDQCVASNDAIDGVGVTLVRLGRALHSADWLHTHWQSDYISMLREFPTEDEASLSLRTVSLYGPASPSVARHVSFLTSCLGSASTVSPYPDIMELPASELSAYPDPGTTNLLQVSQRTTFAPHSSSAMWQDSLGTTVELGGVELPRL